MNNIKDRQLKSICQSPENWSITIAWLEAHFLYRVKPLRTLIFFIVGFTLLLTLGLITTNSFSSQAEDTDNDWNWPEQIYFPQHSSSNEPKPVTDPNSGNVRGRKGGRKGTSNKPPEKDEPRETLPSPYPLLRLAMPIMTNQGLVPSGIYLIQPALSPDALPDEPPPDLQSPQITVALTHGEHTFARLTLTHVGPFTSEGSSSPVSRISSVAETSKPQHLFHFHKKQAAQNESPLTSVHPKSEHAPPVIKVESILSSDKRSIIILFSQGHNHFQSDPLPIMTDTRHQLTF